jgi:septum formation protein
MTDVEKILKSRVTHRLGDMGLMPVLSHRFVQVLLQRVFHMAQPLILASKSAIRLQLLQNAGVSVEVVNAPIDEDMIKAALLGEDAKPRDIADTLAEMKARRVADKGAAGMVLGCDQVLEVDRAMMSKPIDPRDALQQLKMLRGKTHKLLSAAVLVEDSKPVWRFIGEARLSMAERSDAYLEDYVARNWDSIRHSVGAYKLEEEGARLFQRVDGDYFTVLGLPLLPLLGYLTTRGVIDG